MMILRSLFVVVVVVCLVAAQDIDPKTIEVSICTDRCMISADVSFRNVGLTVISLSESKFIHLLVHHSSCSSISKSTFQPNRRRCGILRSRKSSTIDIRMRIFSFSRVAVMHSSSTGRMDRWRDLHRGLFSRKVDGERIDVHAPHNSSVCPRIAQL